MRKLLIAILVLTAAVFAAEMEFQPGPDTGVDAAIYEDAPTDIFSNLNFMRVRFYQVDDTETEHRHGLIHFDLSVLEGATINSAYLTLYNFDSSTDASDYIYIAPADLSWSEVNATWDRMHGRYDDDAKVEYPGAWPADGVYLDDVDVTAIVDGWVNGGETNNGFYIWLEMDSPSSGDMASLKIAASEEVFNPDYRPKLTVDYTAATIVESSWGEIKASN